MNIYLGFKLEIQFIFQFQFKLRKKFKTLGLTAESCSKPNTNNHQLLRNKLKLTLKYALNLRSPGFQFPVFPTRPNISFFRFPNFWPGKSYFLVNFNKPHITSRTMFLPLFNINGQTSRVYLLLTLISLLQDCKRHWVDDRQ